MYRIVAYKAGNLPSTCTCQVLPDFNPLSETVFRNKALQLQSRKRNLNAEPPSCADN
jgi:hypothetical protein